MNAIPLVMCTLVAAAASAQVRTGPPPEIRTLVDATVAALNSGRADAWESFAQAHFSPALLQKQSRAERADVYRQLTDDLGAIEIERVTREGPEAPLDLHVKGAKESGVISLRLAPGQPPRIAGLDVRLGAAGPRDRGGPGVPRPPIDASLTPAEIDKRLDGYFTRLAADDLFSGVALVAKNDVAVFFRAYNLADREKKVANTVHTRFNIGSINKSFTQAAIRQLVREGKLSLTDTLGKLFPDYRQVASRSATVEQLLTHRAGLADFFGPEFTKTPKDRFASNADYFRFVSGLPPVFSPGERNQYCNGCYIALGAIVERVSGMPYEDYVAKNVFARAGMSSTGYPRSDRPEPDMAKGYTRRGGDGALRSNESMHGVAGSAAGGGYSTALDLLAYVKAVRAGRFPGADQDMGIAGGAPGLNAIVEARGEWVVIVLANFDPPNAEQLGIALADALDR
jgi:CubicO group peptidase (beta-lactamase class C family)